MDLATRIVLDTNVLYAGLYSSRGASFQVLRAIERGSVKIVLSTTLLFEYEEVLTRHRAALGLTPAARNALLDDLCGRAEHHRVYFLWRPRLSDPGDDHLLELAVASGTRRIVTYNVRDFKEAGSFGVKAVTPKELLEVSP